MIYLCKKASHWLFPLVFLVFNFNGFSQNQQPKEKCGFLIGIGNYEYMHIGLNLPVKKKHYIEAAIGFKPWNIPKEKYTMGYVCLGRTILKDKERKIQPSIHLKILVWNLENAYYRFTFLGINPEIKMKYRISQQMQVAGSLGVIYNAMLRYQRKTYEEVGWPKEWQPSFSIQALYRIK